MRVLTHIAMHVSIMCVQELVNKHAYPAGRTHGCAHASAHCCTRVQAHVRTQVYTHAHLYACVEAQADEADTVAY